LIWKSESGEKLFESCPAIDISDSGVAIECPESIPLLAHVIVRAPLFARDRKDIAYTLCNLAAGRQIAQSAAVKANYLQTPGRYTFPTR
jgi:hypothetical protein